MKPYDEIFAEKPLRIVSRKSQLAMAQTDIVTGQLGGIAHEIIGVSTSGDEVLDRPLVDIGGKGVFIKSLEMMMIQGKADAAVHSFKDMETVLAEGTSLCAVLEREDRRDALVGPHKTIDALPDGSVIGTSSVRRAALLRHLRPDLKIALLRGNVQRRLSLLEEGQYDAIILAMAGLKRLGLSDLGHPLDEAEFMPSACQGAIAIQITDQDASRKQAMTDAFARLHCEKTAIATKAERALLAQLDGSCRTPIGAMADVHDDGTVTLTGCVLSLDGVHKFDATATARHDEAEALGRQVADDLLQKCGGRSFLA